MVMKRSTWLTFAASTLLITGYLALRLEGQDRTLFLPGETSHGHYQIELACESCHTPLGGVKSSACLACHAEELVRADDSHPPSKFLDPRNTLLLDGLDARECMTCHTEHRPHLTGMIGLTLPQDYCVHCHADIADERPSHAGVGYERCQSAGCHNFHDNRGLHEDYLEAHLDEPPQLTTQLRPSRKTRSEAVALTASQADAPRSHGSESPLLQWSRSGHARGGVNCSGCHGSGDAFLARPGETVCRSCHERQVEGLRAGHHGMRLEAELEPMRPELARLPMKDEAKGKTLGCQSCHAAHTYDSGSAAMEACVGCHDDQHTRAYEASKHASLFRSELAGDAPRGSGVSCATCHMPMIPPTPGSPELFVQHNQNDNLRPNEKMLRTVCTHCHGLGFAIDALADEALVARNFVGRPSVHVESLDWLRVKRAARAQGAVPSE